MQIFPWLRYTHSHGYTPSISMVTLHPFPWLHMLQKFITKVRQVVEDVAMKGDNAVILTSPGIRPFVRSIIERFRPMTVVISQNEIHPKAKIKTVAQI